MICFVILLLWACGVWNIPHPDHLFGLFLFELVVEVGGFMYYSFMKEFK